MKKDKQYHERLLKNLIKRADRARHGSRREHAMALWELVMLYKLLRDTGR
jgi:hypothetical protein